MQAPTESLVLCLQCLQHTAVFLKSGSIDRNNDSFPFFNQNSLSEHMHVHICKYMFMYFCAWLGCGTTAKSKSPDLMLLLFWLLVLLLLVFTLPNKRSHPAGLHRASSPGKAKALLGFQAAHNPSIVPFPSPPVTNDLRQAVNEEHKVNTI